IKSNIAKYFKDDEIKIIVSSFNAKPGDLIVFISDDENIVTTALGALRLKIGEKCGLIDKSKFNFLWIVDFPLVKWDKTELKWQSFHHPFTAPKCLLENINIKENIGKMKSRAYDIILNGVEIGGGSIRIHKSEIQRIVFDILDVSDKLMEEKFNFLLKALSYGAPPHGGIALGFDRLCATILNKESIREVIAFPKTQKGIDVLFNTPDKVSDEQLKELGLNVVL
ncbi:MAG: Asp-tRNA(Asn)/Glu-tRNA(Gln) amidotransferase GatCAB subunit C, partial [Endomicrobium sp.]|nr:Asp-tRNA(Asn)/Glu-tRNA(Gln) amidotransferase GatCAB subunit C [Endomicrobium sp.]